MNNATSTVFFYTKRLFSLSATNPLFLETRRTLRNISVAGANGVNTTVFNLASNPATNGPQNFVFNLVLYNGASSVGNISGLD
jgi:hypothetical protein